MTWCLHSLIPQKNVIFTNIFANNLVSVWCLQIWSVALFSHCHLCTSVQFVCEMEAAIRQSLGPQDWRVGEGNNGLTWALAGCLIFFKFSVLSLADMRVSQYEIVLTKHWTRVPLIKSPTSAIRTGAHDLTQGTFGLNVYHPLNL
jgi:hypothetical protein